MQIDGLFDGTIALLRNSIDLRTKNQNLIASNIANAETPNFVPKTLVFEQELQSVIKNKQSGRQVVTGTIIETPSKSPSRDGNAVELEDEMAKMAENQIKFNASVQLLTKSFEMLRSAIREGK